MKRTFLIILLLLLILALGVLLFGQQILDLYRDLTFNWETATEAEKIVKTYADEHGIPYRSYPKSLIDLLERNPETEEFVLNYPNPISIHRCVWLLSREGILSLATKAHQGSHTRLI